MTRLRSSPPSDLDGALGAEGCITGRERGTQREAKRLERRLDDVMTVAAAQDAHVQRQGRIVGEGAQEMVVERRWHGTAIEGAAAEVERDVYERIVHRHGHIAVARARRGYLVAQRQAERDGDILDQVMAQVAGGVHAQLHAGIAGERGQHVVEEGHGRGNARFGRGGGFAGQHDPDARLARVPLEDRHDPLSCGTGWVMAPV